MLHTNESFEHVEYVIITFISTKINSKLHFKNFSNFGEIFRCGASGESGARKFRRRCGSNTAWHGFPEPDSGSRFHPDCSGSVHPQPGQPLAPSSVLRFPPVNFVLLLCRDELL